MKAFYQNTETLKWEIVDDLNNLLQLVPGSFKLKTNAEKTHVWIFEGADSIGSALITDVIKSPEGEKYTDFDDLDKATKDFFADATQSLAVRVAELELKAFDILFVDNWEIVEPVAPEVSETWFNENIIKTWSGTKWEVIPYDIYKVYIDSLGNTMYIWKDTEMVPISGRGIVGSPVRTSGTGAPGTTDTYTITYSDGTTSTFTVANGNNGTGATLEQVRTQSTGNVPSSKLLDDELNKIKEDLYTKITSTLNYGHDSSYTSILDNLTWFERISITSSGILTTFKLPNFTGTTYDAKLVIAGSDLVIKSVTDIILLGITTDLSDYLIGVEVGDYVGLYSTAIKTIIKYSNTGSGLAHFGTNPTVGGLIVESNSGLSLSYYFSVDSYTYENKIVEKTISGKNKYSSTLMDSTNYAIDNEGNIGQISDWIGAKIPVTSSTTYSFRHFDSQYLEDYVGQLAYLDADEITLSSINPLTLTNAGGLGGKTLTTPAGCAFILKNMYVLGIDYRYTFQLELGTSTTDYEEYKLLIDESIIDTLIARKSDLQELSIQPFASHDVAVMGDSITWMPDTQNWFYYVRQKLTFKSFVNLARSGATWMNWSTTVYDIVSNDGMLASDNVIWNQFNRLKAGITAGTISIPNVIIIASGTNDAWYRSTMFGSVAAAFASNATTKDNNVNTVVDTCSSIRFLVELMRVEWPSAQIIIATPSQTYSSYWANLKICSGLIKDCSAILGVDVIDCFNEAPFSYYCQTNYTDLKYDGTHPSILGAKRFGEYMAAQLKAKIRPIVA